MMGQSEQNIKWLKYTKVIKMERKKERKKEAIKQKTSKQ